MDANGIYKRGSVVEKLMPKYKSRERLTIKRQVYHVDKRVTIVWLGGISMVELDCVRVD